MNNSKLDKKVKKNIYFTLKKNSHNFFHLTSVKMSVTYSVDVPGLGVIRCKTQDLLEMLESFIDAILIV